MDNLEQQNDINKSYVLLPTLTSNINTMDFSYHPKMEIGVMTKDKEFLGVVDYNIENRRRVLLGMDDILKKDLDPVTFEQVHAYFAEKTIKSKDVSENINLLNNAFKNHREKQKDKQKLKLSPQPSPSFSPSIDKEEERKKNLLKISPFTVPTPRP